MGHKTGRGPFSWALRLDPSTRTKAAAQLAVYGMRKQTSQKKRAPRLKEGGALGTVP